MKCFTEPLIEASSLIAKENSGSTTPKIYGEAENRLYAATSAINGSFFGWFGRFGGSGDMPDYQSIKDVPARLKLIRILSTWEDMNKTALSNRKWDGTTYQSENAFASSNVIYALQPNSNKLFVVFLTSKGEVVLPTGKKLVSVNRTNNLFIETSVSASDVTVSADRKIKLNGGGVIGAGYIFTLESI